MVSTEIKIITSIIVLSSINSNPWPYSNTYIEIIQIRNNNIWNFFSDSYNFATNPDSGISYSIIWFLDNNISYLNYDKYNSNVNKTIYLIWLNTSNLKIFIWVFFLLFSKLICSSIVQYKIFEISLSVSYIACGKWSKKGFRRERHFEKYFWKMKVLCLMPNSFKFLRQQS